MCTDAMDAAPTGPAHGTSGILWKVFRSYRVVCGYLWIRKDNAWFHELLRDCLRARIAWRVLCLRGSDTELAGLDYLATLLTRGGELVGNRAIKRY